MNKKLLIPLSLIAGALAGGLAFSYAIAQQTFYVYKDRSGQTVFQDQIPAEYRDKGYKIVSSKGVTLQVVPPKQERRSQTPQFSSPKTDANSSSYRQDLNLLTMYSSVADIEMARDQKINQISEILKSTESYTNAYQRNLDELWSYRDRIPKGDAKALTKVENDMADIAQQIANNKTFIIGKQKELSEIKRKYESEIRRYKKLEAQAKTSD